MKRIAAIVITIVGLALMGGTLLRGEVFSIRDHVGYFQPMRWFTSVELRSGRLPLWNPYSAAGEPWLANPQTGVFYLPTWLFVVLPFTRAYVLYLLLHALLLGAGAFALFVRRVSPPAALIGAVGLMVCGPVLSLVDVSNNFTTLAWLPLVMWCAAAEASPQVSALVIAMSFLAGEPFFALLGALAFALLRGISLWSPLLRTLRGRGQPLVSQRAGLRPALLTALGAFGLVAVQLFPFLETLRGSDRRGGMAADILLRDSMPLADWLRLAVPPQLHSKIVDAHLHQQFLPIVYCGVIIVGLATVALLTSLRRRDAQLAAGAIVVTMLLASGKYFAPVAWMWVHLPLKVLRYPARLVALAAIPLALLAAIGWQWVSQHVTWRFLAFVVLAGVVIDGVAHTAPLLDSRPFQTNPVPHPLGIGRDGYFIRYTSSAFVDRSAWIDGYLNLLDRRFDATTPAPVTNARYNELYGRAVDSPTTELLATMAVRYVLAEKLAPPFVPIEKSRAVTAYLNRRALPIAYFRGDDGRYSAIRFLSIGTSFARIGVDAPSAGTLVLTQQDAPGWTAAVDGKPAGVTTRIAGVFRGVHVGRGQHMVEWTYRPRSLLLGAAVTFLTLVWTLFGLRSMRPSDAFVKRTSAPNFFS